MALKRITITVPAELLRAADRRARELDRSRSWVVADALRRAWGTPQPAAAFAAVREQHLASDVRLTPEQLAHRGEEMVREADAIHPRGEREQVLFFDSYEAFDRWKRAQRIVV